jgi:hypothetical protein
MNIEIFGKERAARDFYKAFNVNDFGEAKVDVAAAKGGCCGVLWRVAIE